MPPQTVEPDVGGRLAALDAAVMRFDVAARALPDLDVVATGEWSARMVVAHIVFWHERFARTVADVAAGRAPQPSGGTLAAFADQARDELGYLGVEITLNRLAAAQTTIRRDIGMLGDVLIPYRQGRIHTPADHLRITTGHVSSHAAELERARR